MKIKELRSKDDKSLGKMEFMLREKLRALRFDLQAGKVKNVKEVKQVRKTIAKILTIMKEKKYAKETTKG
ncbi:50S ribosomal protein L29 [Patescibacteria group bacterium]|nr:50S ribosomal protein L29 [Patescibacteria group bacterium]MBU4023522.1 50S ribosomal protein L29 [Patescibacteria group bacterium]MBU4078018.1 50S ribosomal protein L29 [Patescibacteria group bacterium]